SPIVPSTPCKTAAPMVMNKASVRVNRRGEGGAAFRAFRGGLARRVAPKRRFPKVNPGAARGATGPRAGSVRNSIGAPQIWTSAGATVFASVFLQGVRNRDLGEWFSLH